MNIRKPINSFFAKKQTIFVGLFLVAMTLVILGLGLITKTQANWQRGGFLNQDFRSQSPTTGNLVYALFGDGSTGSTAYTRNWTTSCIPTNVQYLNNPYPGGTLSSNNTIYILSSGNHTLSSNITINGSCIALIGIGDANISGNNLRSLLINNGNKIIIDNIKIRNTANTAFQISNSTGVSLNNVQAYSNPSNGLSSTTSSFINISNSQFYNNGRQGITFSTTTRSTINNVLAYNNTLPGIALQTNSDYNTISNSQFFNNSGTAGMYIATQENLIHNTITYSNTQHGLFMSSP